MTTLHGASVEVLDEPQRRPMPASRTVFARRWADIATARHRADPGLVVGNLGQPDESGQLLDLALTRVPEGP